MNNDNAIILSEKGHELRIKEMTQLLPGLCQNQSVSLPQFVTSSEKARKGRTKAIRRGMG